MSNRAAYLQTMISLASAAFGVVAALAWNSAITALVKQIFGTGAQIVSLSSTPSSSPSSRSS